MKLFCKGDCKDGVVLVATAGVEAQSGRFRMEYKSMPQASMTPVSVSITNLTKSDSGKYSCTSEGTLAGAETQTFVVKVVDGEFFFTSLKILLHQRLRLFADDVVFTDKIKLFLSFSAQTAPQPKFTTTRPPTLETTPMPTSSASGTFISKTKKNKMSSYIVIFITDVLLFCRTAKTPKHNWTPPPPPNTNPNSLHPGNTVCR